MPALQLPPDISVTNTAGDSSGPGVAVYYGPNGVDRADIYIGLNLDGVTTYNNISAVNNTIKMQYFEPPTLDCQGEDMTFNHKSDKTIDVTVSY